MLDPLWQFIGLFQSGGEISLSSGVEKESDKMNDLLEKRGGFHDQWYC